MLDPSLLASPIVQAFGGLGLVLWIAQLLFTTSIAQAKGLNWFFWGVGALLFPLLAFLAVLGMPDRKQRLLMRQLGEQLMSICLLYTSPSPRDRTRSRMPSSA